jgi:TDG/mug DNA glycosylase family protein
MTLCTSFPPAGSEDPIIMILGSMPGPTSFKKEQYYGHPQNAFWKIMGDLFGAFPDISYEKRLKIIADNRITFWDTLSNCIRPGSADSDISEKVANDFNTYFIAHPNVRRLFFDGASSYHIFRRLVLPNLKRLDIVLTPLPSTSPRNANMRYPEKLAAWKIVKEFITI